MLIACLAQQPAFARQASHPKAQPSASAAQLKDLERKAAESRARADALAAQTAKIQKDLAAQRQALTEAAAGVRAGEEALSRLEAEQAALSQSVDGDAALLGTDRAKLVRLTAGLVRLTRIPPGGLLTGFDAPIDAARAEILLQSALAAIREGAQQAEQELARLNDLSAELQAKRHEGERQAEALKSRQAKLAALVDQRQSLYLQTDSDRRAEEERAQKIADEAKDLRDLVARIEAQQKAEREEAARSKARIKVAPPPGHFTAGAGLPVAGEVKIRFGQNDGLGTTSHGITIIARSGATVTAPSAGTVRFAGPFRGYRQILILEHPGGYLSLIAGMARINAPLGAPIGAGEPVGTMDDRADSRPELYYELRRNGQFVDPQASTLPVAVKGRVR